MPEIKFAPPFRPIFQNTMVRVTSHIMYDVIMSHNLQELMSVTIAAALFETNFIILPYFFCHVKAAAIIKRAARNS